MIGGVLAGVPWLRLGGTPNASVLEASMVAAAYGSLGLIVGLLGGAGVGVLITLFRSE
jgi:hypothetical protein